MAEAMQAFMGVNIASMYSGLITAGQITLALIVSAIIVYLIIYYLKFNKKVMLILKIGGGGIRIAWDKGYRDSKKKEFKVLYHRSIIFNYPKTEEEYPSGRGTLIPFVVVNGQGVSVKGIADNGLFIPADINMFQHMVGRIKQNYELTKPKPSFWDKYGKDILLASMMVILLVGLILILKRVDDAIAMGRQVISFANERVAQVITN